MAGVWKLVIVDHRNEIAPGSPANPAVEGVDYDHPGWLHQWGLTFSSNINTSNFANDRLVTGASTVTNSATNNFANKPPVAPTNGIAPGIHLAQDRTLGSFSPYQGSVYVVYTSGGGTNTDVMLSRYDGTTTWAAAVKVNDDNVYDAINSEGNRNQFNPAIAIDDATGAVAVTFYDSRYDASNAAGPAARVTTALATSIDGGSTWSQNVMVNNQKTAYDQATLSGQDVVVLEPIPSNQAAAGTLGFGNQMGVVAYNGRSSRSGQGISIAARRCQTIRMIRSPQPRAARRSGASPRTSPPDLASSLATWARSSRRRHGPSAPIR